MLVVVEIFPSSTTELAHVVLPGAAFFEKDGTFTNGERRVQRVRRVIDPPGQAWPEWKILCELMKRCGFAQPFSSPSDIMDEIASVAPPFAGISYGRLEDEGMQWPVRDAMDLGTPILHQQTFPLGRAHLACVDFEPSPSLGLASGELQLMTGRALEHYNNGSMTRRTPNQVLLGEDALEIHPDDASARGIDEGVSVTIRSAQGDAHAIARLTTRVLPGTAFLTFHYPETGTNDLTTAVLDRLADTPEYKLTPVRVERST